MGFSQADLALRCGLSRQFVNLIEAGRTQPNVQVALRLAEALECSVEKLFQSCPSAPAPALVVRLAEPSLPDGARLRIARVAGHWVGHAADTMLSLGAGFAEADAVLSRAGVRTSARTHRPTEELEQNIAIAGCDPALALLQGTVPGLPGRCFWVNCGSAAALDPLADGWVHAAGLHYSGEEKDANLRHVERRDKTGRWEVLRFTRWEQGWMIRIGEGAAFHGAADLASGRMRLANREPGSGSRHWLDAQIAQSGVNPGKIPGFAKVHTSHWDCARALVEGRADVAVGPRAVATVFALDFIPATEVAFDLVLSRSTLGHPRVDAMLQRIRSRGFRRELDMFPGYQTADAGTLVQRT
jgi:molybdate-binding protein/DNA-binding XRE family transcriptional regulator